MATPTDVRSEIDGLRADLAARSESAVGPEQSDNSEPERWHEVERTLRDLRKQLTETAEHGDALLTEHPLAGIAAAFVLGFVAGTLIGRAK